MTATRVGAGVLLSVCLASAQFSWFHIHKPTAKKSDTQKDAGKDGFLGVVVKKGTDSFTIRAVDTRVITFNVADSTLYFHGSKWATPSQVRRGTVVKVEATADHEGILTATDVVLQDIDPVFKPRTQASGMLPGGVKDDPLVQRAREASGSFFGMLPNFLCQQSTTRSYSSADKHWRSLDQVTAEVVYDHGHELYRDVKLNGRPTGHSMMDLPGSRSTGEFGSTLRALFDKETEALFKFQSSACADSPRRSTILRCREINRTGVFPRVRK